MLQDYIVLWYNTMQFINGGNVMKAVFYISNNPNWGHVSKRVWDALEREGYFTQKAGILFGGNEVMKHTKDGNEFYFVPTDTAICLDYPRFLPEMNEYFSNFDMSAMVTWHEGAHAPENVCTVHSLGDVNSGVYGNINSRFMRNLLLNYDKQRKLLGLDEYKVVTEATHWSGVYDGNGDASLLTKYPVPMVDIEVGSSTESWNDDRVCTALARTLPLVFNDDKRRVHNILCVGGIHFEPNFASCVFSEFGDNEAFGVTHIIANQWLVSGCYEENGLERMRDCINAIDGGIEAIFFHDKLKGCYKDLVRNIGKEYNVPVYKHQRLRKPEELEWGV